MSDSEKEKKTVPLPQTEKKPHFCFVKVVTVICVIFMLHDVQDLRFRQNEHVLIPYNKMQCVEGPEERRDSDRGTQFQSQ